MFEDFGVQESPVPVLYGFSVHNYLQVSPPDVISNDSFYAVTFVENEVDARRPSPEGLVAKGTTLMRNFDILRCQGYLSIVVRKHRLRSGLLLRGRNKRLNGS